MMNKSIPYYGMFTDEGNAAVHRDIVLFALEAKLNWSNVQAMLDDLSQIEGFREASDMAVREEVFNALACQIPDKKSAALFSGLKVLAAFEAQW